MKSQKWSLVLRLNAGRTIAQEGKGCILTWVPVTSDTDVACSPALDALDGQDLLDGTPQYWRESVSCLFVYFESAPLIKFLH